MGLTIGVLAAAMLAGPAGEESSLSAAKQHFEAGEYLATLKTLKAVEAEPESAEAVTALSLKAVCLRKLGDTKGSVECFARLAEAHPECAQSQEGFGRGLVRLGKLEKARGVLARAAKLDPQDVDVLCSLGEYHIAAGELGAAEEVLREAADYAPEHARVAEGMVGFLLADQDPEAALETAQEFAAAAPKDPVGPCLEGRIHWSQGQMKAAISAFRKALECDERCLDAHQSLALLGHKLTSKGKDMVDLTQHHYDRYFELGGSSAKMVGKSEMWTATRAKPEVREEARKNAKKKASKDKAAKKAKALEKAKSGVGG